MSNPEHFAIVRAGRDAISRFRKRNPNVGLDLNEAELGRFDLSNVNLSRSWFIAAELESADLSNADLTDSDLSYANLEDAILDGTRLIRADLEAACLAGCDLTTCVLTDARMFSVDLIGADLSRLDLAGADLRAAEMQEAILEQANLSNSNLGGANLDSCQMTQINLSSADLSGAELCSSDVDSSNLRAAKLVGAKLNDVNLSESDLSGADLTGADLTGADLTNTDLTGAILINAILIDVDLTGAVLTNVKFNKHPGALYNSLVDSNSTGSLSDSECGSTIGREIVAGQVDNFRLASREKAVRSPVAESGMLHPNVIRVGSVCLGILLVLLMLVFRDRLGPDDLLIEANVTDEVTNGPTMKNPESASPDKNEAPKTTNDANLAPSDSTDPDRGEILSLDSESSEYEKDRISFESRLSLEHQLRLRGLKEEADDWARETARRYPRLANADNGTKIDFPSDPNASTRGTSEKRTVIYEARVRLEDQLRGRGMIEEANRWADETKRLYPDLSGQSKKKR